LTNYAYRFRDSRIEVVYNFYIALYDQKDKNNNRSMIFYIAVMILKKIKIIRIS